jgi:hypothetical protein
MKPSNIVKWTKKIRRLIERELKGGTLPGGHGFNIETLSTELGIKSDLSTSIYNMVVREWPCSFTRLESEIYKIIENYDERDVEDVAKYEKGKVRKGNVLLEAIDFAVDTALSWDGEFPKVDKGDYIVMIEDSRYDEPTPVLVSRRYTAAVDADQAAEIALDAWGERKGYGGPEDGSDTIRVVRVDAVMK